MAMTKAEQVKMKALEEALRIAKALRWSNRPEPVKLLPPPPSGGPGAIHGWHFNAYRGTNDSSIGDGAVYPVTTQSITHYVGEHLTREMHRGGGWRQNGVRVYASRHDALVGLRRALEQSFAEKLAQVDAEIEKEEGSGGQG